MNYTEKYHLPQWEETDRIMRSDFNEAMANIDQGVAQAAVMPFAVGDYEGKALEQEIYVGFRPSFLIICTNQAGDSISEMGRFSGFSATQSSSGRVVFTDTGFRVATISSAFFPRVNENGSSYTFIAFR